MVRALLDGTKTQTRRIVKPHPPAWACEYSGLVSPYGSENNYLKQAGQLWVRETFSPIYPQDPLYNDGQPIEYDYAATYKHGFRLGDSLGIKKIWKPSIHMPRRASRITLEITGVRVERLQDISEADAQAEGCLPLTWDGKPGLADLINWPLKTVDRPYANDYAVLWESINGPGSWDANPWVWVVEFARLNASLSGTGTASA